MDFTGKGVAGEIFSVYRIDNGGQVLYCSAESPDAAIRWFVEAWLKAVRDLGPQLFSEILYVERVGFGFIETSQVSSYSRDSISEDFGIDMTAINHLVIVNAP